jgi:L-fuconolactonase
MSGKHHEGRDEPILDPDLPIIDTHHHLFIRQGLRYMFEDYLADAGAGHNIRASVYVETRAMARVDGPEVLRPLGEVEFANGVAAMSASGTFGPCRVAAAIVGYADLSLGEPVAELLDRALATAPERFRGIRQITLSHPDDAVYRYLGNPPPRGLMERPGFRPGFRQLAPRKLSFDATVLHHQLPDVGALAAEHPDTVIVLGHMGLALAMDQGPEVRAEVFHDWHGKLIALARHPNVFCKIGGLGTAYWGFGFDQRPDPVSYLDLAETWKPYVETAIEAFGADRCMMESNYPPDGRSCGFVPLWNALKHITRACSVDERAALFHRTAAWVYRIGTA